MTSWIDTDGDHAISSAESVAYGRQVLQSLTLSVDGLTAPIQLIDVQAPTIPEMAAGVGMFRVRASVDMPTSTTGRHQLSLINAHHPELSVYLANALVPADNIIRILAQRRTTISTAHDRLRARTTAIPGAGFRGCWLLGPCSDGGRPRPRDSAIPPSLAAPI